MVQRDDELSLSRSRFALASCNCSLQATTSYPCGAVVPSRRCSFDAACGTRAVDAFIFTARLMASVISDATIVRGSRCRGNATSVFMFHQCWTVSVRRPRDLRRRHVLADFAARDTVLAQLVRHRALSSLAFGPKRKWGVRASIDEMSRHTSKPIRVCDSSMCESGQ